MISAWLVGSEMCLRDRGVFVIFVLVAMLLGLFSWLKADILHSLTLLEGGIR